LSGYFFAIAIQPILNEIKQRWPKVKLAAILDDVTIAGPSEDAFAAFDWLQERGRTTGYFVNKDKTMVLHCDREPSQDIIDGCRARELPAPVKAMKCLGSVIGRDDAKAIEVLRDKVDDACELMKKLLNPNITLQNAFAYLRYCCQPRLVYLARTMQPAVAEQELKRFDDAIQETAIKLLDLHNSEQTDAVKMQMSLPIRLGGLGLRPMHGPNNHGAYLAAFGTAAREVEELNSEWLEEIDGNANRQRFLNSLAQQPAYRSVASAIETIKQHNVTQLNEDGLYILPRGNTAAGYVEFINQRTATTHEKESETLIGATGLQEEYQEQLDDKAHTDWCREARRHLDRKQRKAFMARQHAIRVPSANVAFHAWPAHPDHRLHDAPWRCMTRIRHGLQPSSINNIPGHCSCPKRVDLHANPTHMLHCMECHNPNITMSHHRVRNCLHRELRKAGFFAVREKRFKAYGVQSDLYFSDSNGNKFVVDVSGTMPTAPSYVKAAANGQLRAAKLRETKKKNHYARLTHDFPDITLVPFIFERFGGINDAGINLLKRITHHAVEHLGEDEVDYAQYLEELKQSVAIDIHKGNHAIVKSALQELGYEDFVRRIQEMGPIAPADETASEDDSDESDEDSDESEDD
jgi:hypothetical protein